MTSQEQVQNKTRKLAYNSSNLFKYEHFIAGVSGGVISTVTLHPLDLLKIRFEVNDGVKYKTNYSSIWNGLTTIYKREGIKGLYRGCLPGTIGAGSSWGFYFYFYTSLKYLEQHGDIDKPLSAHQHMIAASEAGLLTLIITNPVWVCKTRLCLQSDRHTPLYTGMTDALVKIYKQDGIRGWYKGFLPGIVGVSHGAIQFTIYEAMKNFYYERKDSPITTKLSVIEYITFAAISKIVAATVTYPHQVIRARMQNQFYSFSGVWNCIHQTWHYEGWRGFYKGLATTLIRVVPATIINFVVYENLSHFLISRKSNK